jgi:internalin A
VKNNAIFLLFNGYAVWGEDTQPINPNQRTHGIALETWKDELPHTDVQVWDFGGQDIFHSTHRLFLGQRAVYVLVWTRQESKKCFREEQHPLRYWLDFIADFGQDSTVLLVENTINDQFDSKEFPDDASLEQLIGEYKKKNITLVPTHHRIDCQSGTDDVLVFKSILQTRISQLINRTASHEFPANRYEVQQALIQLRATNHILAIEEYQRLCDKHNISNSEALLRYLHLTGVVSYFEGLFSDRIVLRTDWLLDAMYALLKIEDNPIKKKKGKLKEKDFATVWSSNYSDDEQKLFREYMLKSELIARPLTSKRSYRYIVPALFPLVKRHEEIKWESFHSYVVIKFRFLYRAVMQRLQVRILNYCHVEEEENLYQNRISFTDQAGKVAHIEVIEAEKEMRIWAENEDLYDKILAELRRIYPLDRVQISRRVLRQPDSHYEESFFSESLDNYPLNHGFESPLNTQKNMGMPVSIFVTYCWSDKAGNVDHIHQNYVRNLVDALEEYKDFDATFDQYENELASSVNFIEMMYKNLEGRDKVIVVLSEGYAHKANEFKGGVGNEYSAIVNHIKSHPNKFCLVSFEDRRAGIYPFGLQGNDTIILKNGDLEASINTDEKNRLFAKLLDEPIYVKPPKGNKVAIVQKK